VDPGGQLGFVQCPRELLDVPLAERLEEVPANGREVGRRGFEQPLAAFVAAMRVERESATSRWRSTSPSRSSSIASLEVRPWRALSPLTEAAAKPLASWPDPL
jgi:hypothetical protein